MKFRTITAAACAFAAIAAIAATAADKDGPADIAALPGGAGAAAEAQAAGPGDDGKPAARAAIPDEPGEAARPAEEPAPRKKPRDKAKKALTGRDAKITSETMAYNRKDGVIFFDRKVYVDDEQYQMHADRVYVFLSGTNDVKRLVAVGNVALTNEFRSATCDKAVYVKAASKVVLYAPDGGVATLKDESEKGGTITGSKITFWLDSEQVEVQQSDITVPGGAFRANDAKKLLGN